MSGTFGNRGDLRFSNNSMQARIDDNDKFVITTNGVQESSLITDVVKLNEYRYEIVTEGGTYLIVPAPSWDRDYGGYFMWMEQLFYTYHREPQVDKNPQSANLRF